MKVFVAGGTGAIGGHAVPALIAEGHTVTALARSPEKATVLSAQGAKAVSASLHDRAGLTARIADHDAVVNLTSAIPPMAKFMLAREGDCSALRLVLRARCPAQRGVPGDGA
jgi:uncharacterized protein YbjT (DUF2867 family)